jgi:ribosomal protein L16 Arg81 hydroxylase
LDTTYLEKIKGSGSHLFDHLLSFGKTSRQHTLFLSTRDCTFAKHAHIISGLIIHLYGQKTWYVSKSYDSFGSIKYKRLVYPNPLYITDKNPTNEIAFTVGPGDMIYMPAYWFHYTHSDDVNISYNHFFTEKIQYYLNRTLLMFLYQSFTNPIHSFIKAVRNEPEEHIFDRQQVIDNCNKIKNDIQRQKALIFFRDNDYS